MLHLTTLIAWHDSGWNGKVCEKPKEIEADINALRTVLGIRRTE